MAARPCATCGGLKLRPEALAVVIGGSNITQVTNRSIAQAVEWISVISGDAPSRNGTDPSDLLTEREKVIGEQILKEIEARLELPAQHRTRLPDALAHRLDAERRRSASASGWRRRSAPG